MIDLYQFRANFGVANLSPFCMKLEGFLRLTDIPFQIIIQQDPSKAPKGKLPYIRDNGVVIADSELVIDYLEAKLDFNFDAHLSPATAAIHHGFMRMLDEHLYWALVYSRWHDDSNYNALRARLFSQIPPPFSMLIASYLRYNIRKQLYAQGMGRHSADDIYAKASKDIRALSDYLGRDQWFGGEFASKLDINAVTYINNILIPELPSPLADCLRKHRNLCEFAERATPLIFAPQAADTPPAWMTTPQA